MQRKGISSRVRNRLPSMARNAGAGSSRATASDIPSNEAFRILISSMRAADTASTAQAIASRSMTARNRSRFRSVICFESLSCGSWKSGGRITAAANTGPARQPRPASSHPASASSY